jgi:hypothetical protein
MNESSEPAGVAVDRDVRPAGMYPRFDARTVTLHHKATRANKTGFLGVKWVARAGVFAAYIRVHGRKEKLYCGRGATAEEAARKYDLKARELYGDSAVTNFEA